MLQISDEIEKDLPSSVKTSLSKLTDEQQSIFEEEFNKKRKSKGVGLVLAICLWGWSFVYRGQVGKAFLFWLTLGGVGIWWIIDMVTVTKKIQEMNEDLAKTILRDMKMMNS